MAHDITIFTVTLHNTEVGNVVHFDTNLGAMYYFKGQYTLEVNNGHYFQVDCGVTRDLLESELRTRVFNNGWEV